MSTLETKTARPGSVSAAVYIQYVLIALSAISAVLTAIFGAKINEAVKYNLNFNGANKDQTDAMANIGGGGALGIATAVISIAVFLALTILVAKGNQVARVITWVLSGLSVLLSGLGLVGTLALSSMDKMTAEATQAGYDAVGGWYGPWLTVNIVISMIGALAVIVLLALPASHPYFRKTQPEAQLPPEAYR